MTVSVCSHHTAEKGMTVYSHHTDEKGMTVYSHHTGEKGMTTYSHHTGEVIQAKEVYLYLTGCRRTRSFSCWCG